MEHSDIELDLFIEGLRQALPGQTLQVDKVMPFGVGAHVFFPNGLGVSLQDIGSRLAEVERLTGRSLQIDHHAPDLELAALAGCVHNFKVSYISASHVSGQGALDLAVKIAGRAHHGGSRCSVCPAPRHWHNDYGDWEDVHTSHVNSFH